MSSPHTGAVMEEKKDASTSHEEDCCVEEVGKDDEIKSAKAEMGEVKEENERLKMMLEQVEKDYQSLQLRFFDTLQKEASEKDTIEDSVASLDETEESEMVSLCLGRSPREPKNDGRNGNCKKPKEHDDLELASSCLTLGLDSTSQLSMELASESSEEPKETEAGRGTWPTNKSLKSRNGDDEISEQMPNKRARVSVRARCDTPTMNDGCQWRKYGQKIAKGNPCPRAYYRCTVAPACPVRKQVQRCAEDMSILITTYEGTHNHPLPVSATAMASTTSAAASMLLSESSTSQPSSHSSAAPFGTVPTVLNGLNFSHFDQSRAKQALLPNLAASPLFPTITLDLTSTSSSLPTHVSRLPSAIASSPRYPPTNLNFCSLEPAIVPSLWGNGFPNNGTLPIEKNPMRSFNLGNQFQEHFYQQCMKNQAPSRDALAETLTKAISTDPSLRSVIAAAVTSIVGQGSTNRNQGGGEISGPGLSLNLGYQHGPVASNTYPPSQNGKGFLSGYFNRLLSSSSSNGGHMLQPSLPFSVSKSSTTPSIIDQINH